MTISRSKRSRMSAASTSSSAPSSANNWLSALLKARNSSAKKLAVCETLVKASRSASLIRAGFMAFNHSGATAAGISKDTRTSCNPCAHLRNSDNRRLRRQDQLIQPRLRVVRIRRPRNIVVVGLIAPRNPAIPASTREHFEERPVAASAGKPVNACLAGHFLPSGATATRLG